MLTSGCGSAGLPLPKTLTRTERMAAKKKAKKKKKATKKKAKK